MYKSPVQAIKYNKLTPEKSTLKSRFFCVFRLPPFGTMLAQAGGFILSGGELWRVKDRLSNAISVVIENLTVNASIMGKL